ICLFFQAEDGIRDYKVTGVQTCALPILNPASCVIALEQGRILAQGTPQQVLEAPRHESIAQLAGFENIFDAVVTTLRPEQGTMRSEERRVGKECGSRIAVALGKDDVAVP